MITDPHRILLFHCHPCPEGVYEGRRTGGEDPEVFRYGDGTVDALAKDLASLGIEKAVAFAPWEVPEGWAISRMPFDHSQARHGRGANECDWMVRAGAHGFIWPIMASEFTIISPPMENDIPFRIGRGEGTAYQFHGLIDEILIANVALDESDVKSIMNQGLEKATGLIAVFPSGRLATT
jgi:hypothetical protein